MSRKLIEGTNNSDLIGAIYNNLGVILEKEGNINLAHQLYKKAYSLIPNNWVYMNLCGFEEDHGLEKSVKIPKKRNLHRSSIHTSAILIDWKKPPSLVIPQDKQVGIFIIFNEEKLARHWGEVFYDIVEELDFIPVMANNYQLFLGTSSFFSYLNDKEAPIYYLLLHISNYKEELREEYYEKPEYLRDKGEFRLVPYFKVIRFIDLEAEISLIGDKKNLFSKKFRESIEEEYLNKKKEEVPPYNFSLWRKLLTSNLQELKELSSQKICSSKRYYIQRVK
jgi:tetratricopeptide (TPR) repeat protein